MLAGRWQPRQCCCWGDCPGCISHTYLLQGYAGNQNILRNKAYNPTAVRLLTKAKHRLQNRGYIYTIAPLGTGVVLDIQSRSKYPTQFAEMSFDEILDLTADVFLTL